MAALAALLSAPLSAQGKAQGKALPVFTDGMAQKVDAFSQPRDWIREQLWVETEFDSDGDKKPDRVHVNVVRQEQTETEGLKVPVIYETSPYYAGVGGNAKEYFWNPKHELGAKPPERTPLPDIRHDPNREVITRNPTLQRQWLPRGFAVVYSESPGTGRSQGCPTVGGKNEALAPKAVIDWLNGRAKGYSKPRGGKQVKADWCTGKVGMTGTSYNGTLPIAAATTGVEGLDAIIPIAPNTSYYHYYRSNGLVRHPGGYMGEDLDVLYDFINSGSPKRRDYCNKVIRDELMAMNMDRMTGDYSEFWAGRDYLNQLEKFKTPTLMAHAFNDWNVMPEHSVRVYAALKQKGVPCMAYFHQGGHGGPPPFDMQNRWFTRYLYGVENDVESGPRAWIVREGERKPTAYDDYPNPAASPVSLYLTAGGNQAGGLVGERVEGQEPETAIDDVKFPGRVLASAEQSPNRLLYLTEPLQAPVHLSGTAKIKVRLTSDKPAVNLSVWLVSLPWERGRVYKNIITRGWADPQNRSSLTAGEPLVPGKFVDVSFDLQPDDHVVPVGQSIGLMIFASDRDFTLWPEAGTKLTVDISGASLDLPVVGGSAAWAKAFAK
ncbi:MAG: Xaa-Pro dipeptidyl-peptidase [bacterium]|nr:Xaa-Pro dipeptidyl-peptidase [bacterium]